MPRPALRLSDPFAHADSRRNLLGNAAAAGDAGRATRDAWSLDTRVRADMPPVFVVHTTEDRSVPVENSLLLVEAMRKAGVPVEAHIYERGAHGFGMAAGLGTTSGWVDRWLDWMRAGGWL